MRFLSRAGLVIALLGVLGYGSYAFGRYVLSSKLFGNSVVPSSTSGFVAVSPTAVTRKTEYQGDSPRVEVQVMDADSAGPGPAPPSIDDLRRNAEERAASRGPSRAAEPEFQSTPETVVRRSNTRRFEDGVMIGDGSDEERPRRRRKRRRKTADAETTAAATQAAGNTTARASSESSSNNSSETSATVLPETNPSGSDGGSRNSENDAPRGERSVSSDDRPKDVTPRRRRRRRVETSSEPAPRKRVRERPARTIESPVPQPEGGDSPVPMPE